MPVILKCIPGLSGAIFLYIGFFPGDVHFGGVRAADFEFIFIFVGAVCLALSIPKRGHPASLALSGQLSQILSRFYTIGEAGSMARLYGNIGRWFFFGSSAWIIIVLFLAKLLEKMGWMMPVLLAIGSLSWVFGLCLIWGGRIIAAVKGKP